MAVILTRDKTVDFENNLKRLSNYNCLLSIIQRSQINKSENVHEDLCVIEI
jgi:hypothetical protein